MWSVVSVSWAQHSWRMHSWRSAHRIGKRSCWRGMRSTGTTAIERQKKLKVATKVIMNGHKYEIHETLTWEVKVVGGRVFRLICSDPWNQNCKSNHGLMCTDRVDVWHSHSRHLLKQSNIPTGDVPCSSDVMQLNHSFPLKAAHSFSHWGIARSASARWG